MQLEEADLLPYWRMRKILDMVMCLYPVDLPRLMTYLELERENDIHAMMQERGMTYEEADEFLECFGF